MKDKFKILGLTLLSGLAFGQAIYQNSTSKLLNTNPKEVLVPIVRQMKTSGGVSFGWLYDNGLVRKNSDGKVNSSEEFERAAKRDYDCDGHSNGEEYILGTNPKKRDKLEYQLKQGKEGIEISTKPNIENRIYEVFSKTNLESKTWEYLGSYTNNFGRTNGKFVDKRNLNTAFYKIRIGLK